ncbi:dTDP-glucose 4,6-dehydratase [Acidocella aminolytica]|jgi:dTDP-glucose 4,6-dehydratase|uniref:dTDP-glucose 4,6-dehydratase n=1 Tax=Acidocella aminolytica 101 = DSM 11237 TaxID=1120923 RepID=A0A0D6PGQ6_9PROT|nr:dTDP-glucose 4,6-dehydratase [Acidocella aminolytica]GAN80832.1 dTDP-glucose 4,6-dehydratase [Acidocella aminolytica 101 = DSM 11237]GBQ35692.1 dTDP-glucose 4,6-dehydratase [Acidocella aminolytica 101 = DSM 11237]SHE32316.1 dTDP-glucose 4,6-dehydratase [Acidocella aminolytica 101 = DSM 11237]
MKILLTGGCGFIGSAVVRRAVRQAGHQIINIDKMTYAASEDALEDALHHPNHALLKQDICDLAGIRVAFATHQPDVVMHLAAESHVDRSIDGPAAFVHTNITGTFVMLEAAREYFATLSGEKKEKFRFHHISTDEVFGALADEEPPFNEHTPYDPRSPYSSSKAASDHLARAWMHTYNLPVIVSNTTNNYGKWQFPEKLIPLMLINAIEEKPLPVYGDGKNTRDWLFVDDHAEALLKVVTQGVPGETYCIGARQPQKNIDVVKAICSILDRKLPSENGARERLITYVTDRPGHDHRYEIDPSSAETALDWTAAHDFERGLAVTIGWYLDHRPWWEGIRSKKYSGQRLGAGA